MAGAARRPTTTAGTPSRHSRRSGRSLRSSCSRAVCWTGCSLAPTYPMRLTTHSWRGSQPNVAPHLSLQPTSADMSSTSVSRVTMRPSSSPFRETDPMTDLLWPGDARGGDLLTDASFLRAMLAVEEAWLDVLGIAHGPLPELDPTTIPSEEGGNPVIALAAILRQRLEGDAARWVHRGLTSQDVIDSALMMMVRDAVSVVRGELREQIARLADLAETYRAAPMVARTLTQHAVPTTFGLKVSGWLTGVLDADENLASLSFPVQLGGAAGTLAAVV